MSACGNFSIGRYGRLGNQLFQIYAALGYQYRYAIDELHFNSAPILKHLNVEYKVAKAIPNSATLRDNSSIKFVDFPRHENSAMFGYFQSWKYHADIPEAFFKTKLDAIERSKYYGMVMAKDTTFLHIRRGDYVDVCSNLLTMDYYKKAIETIGEDNLLVFSDDIPYCKTVLGDYDCTYIEGMGPMQDMLLMSFCNHGIMSNSSFSWWGARLNNTGGKFIGPKHWFNNTIIDSEDIILPNWVSI